MMLTFKTSYLSLISGKRSWAAAVRWGGSLTLLSWYRREDYIYWKIWPLPLEGME